MALNTNRSSNIFTNPRIAQLDAQLWKQVTGKERRIQTVSPPTSKVSPPLPTPKAKLPLPTPREYNNKCIAETKKVKVNLPSALDAAAKAKQKADLLFRLKVFAGK